MTPRRPQDGAKTASRRPQVDPRSPREAPRALQEGSKLHLMFTSLNLSQLIFQDGSKMAPRCPQDGPRCPQDAPKTAQEGPTWPNWDRLNLQKPLETIGFRRFSAFHRFPSRSAQDGSKTAPRWPQEAPRWPRRGPKMAPRAPKMAPTRPQAGSKTAQRLAKPLQK